MSLSILKGKQVDVHLWTQLDQVESSALDQLRNIAALPWAFHHVAVMPDVHFGKGATVGSVVAMKGAGAPAQPRSRRAIFRTASGRTAPRWSVPFPSASPSTTGRRRALGRNSDRKP